MAFVLARGLAWPSRLVARAVACAVAGIVVLAPMSLERNDLKQYTCDAFCALTLLTVAAAVDRSPSRVSIWRLAAVAVILLPFSATSAFVAAAAFAGILGSALVSRDAPRARETLAVGALTGAVLSAYYVVAIGPKLSSAVVRYWANLYLYGSILRMFTTTWDRINGLGRYLGMPGAIFAALFVIGCVVLARRGETAFAVTVPVLWVEMMLVGRLHKYPFLDLRTSHFLLVSSLAVVAIGGVGLVMAIAAAVHRFAGVAAALILLAMFVANSSPYIHNFGIPREDVRTTTLLVAKIHRARDVILVSGPAAFGFAYYWPDGSPTLHTDPSGTGFRAEAGGVDAIYVSGRGRAPIRAALQQAVHRWRYAGSGSRLFIIRSHVLHRERVAWRRAFTLLHLRPRILGPSWDPSYVLGPPLDQP